jgi:hypothetical protein
MTRSGPEQDRDHGSEPPRRSAAAEAAALRWEESQPDDPADPTPAAADEKSRPAPVDRRSASAEAAALRWQEQHEDADAG